MPFIYSPRYHADIGEHVFPTEKYRLIYDKLVKELKIPASEFVEPRPATDDQVLLVHTADYMDDLKNLRWTARTQWSELPLTEEVVEMFLLAAGGTIEACRLAVERRWACHIGGGFHHAFPARAEGFCYINDLAVGIRVAQKEGLIRRAAVIDCDLHQGNGTAAIFQGDDSVFTFSIHQRDLYPVKERSDRDVHLPNHVGDEEYLAHIEYEIPRILREFQPDLVLYQAGADPYMYDQLGDLNLSMEGLERRDRFILRECRRRAIPVAVTLGGGYAVDTADTVQIHFNTCKAAWEIFRVAPAATGAPPSKG